MSSQTNETSSLAAKLGFSWSIFDGAVPFEMCVRGGEQ